jgi:hypothetical protein
MTCLFENVKKGGVVLADEAPRYGKGSGAKEDSSPASIPSLH